MQEQTPARIVVNLNGNQTRAHITRFAPDTMVGDTRIYRNVTPSSAARLRRVLGDALWETDLGTWRAELSAPVYAPEPAPPAPNCDLVEALAPGLTAPAPRMIAPFPYWPGLRATDPYAPRPLWTAALTRYKLGILAGERRYRCLGSLEWYRQRRRARPGRYARHAGPVMPTAPADWTALTVAQWNDGLRQCHRCGQLAQGEDMWLEDPGYLCQECWERACARAWWEMLSGKSDIGPIKPPHLYRARYARIPYDPDRARQLRQTRMRPTALRWNQRALFVSVGPRFHTRHRLGPVTLRALGRRRALVARALRRGLQRVRAGIWYDQVASLAYIQTSRALEPCEHIRLGAA